MNRLKSTDCTNDINNINNINKCFICDKFFFKEIVICSYTCDTIICQHCGKEFYNQGNILCKGHKPDCNKNSEK